MLHENMKRTLIPAAAALVLLAGAWLIGTKIRGNAPAVEQSATKQAATAQPKPAASPNLSAVKLSPLPADNKTAIDSEIRGIDQELANIENGLSAGETADEELGL